jgi:hypothetical protein
MAEDVVELRALQRLQELQKVVHWRAVSLAGRP